MTDADLVKKKLALIETYVRELQTLARHGWLDEYLARSLRAAVGFRNVLVHGYASVDRTIVRDILENHLQDLTAFVSAVRLRLKI